MVTLPSQPHRARSVAESFGVDPGRYDRSRPPYPDALIEHIVAAAPGPAFIDVGCGTGIAARQFRAAGCRVVGVEPDPRMAGFARATGVDVEVATFETWEPAGRNFDAIVSGTAWHWVDPVAGAAKAAEILRPGGVLAPFGHVYELPSPIAAALAAGLRRAAPNLPYRQPTGSILDGYRALYDRAAEGVRASGCFAEPEIRRYDWQRTYAPNELLELITTSGGLASAPPDALAEILSTVTAAVDGDVTLTYATWRLTAVRR
ncbi:class I SAM-dependent methyltransferase [Micromonospora sp. NPDC093244]|uniref:class I SAM-dependent methyltransferase n=1 Tax=Micromonospora sp. NPDC093244 TaxID=3155071 RepID=UPI0034413785